MKTKWIAVTLPSNYEGREEEWIAKQDDAQLYRRVAQPFPVGGYGVQKEVDSRILDSMGNKEFWAKTRKEIEREGQDSVNNLRGQRADVNKLHSSSGYAKWRIKSTSRTLKADVEHKRQYTQGLLDVHKERVEEALSEGKPVPASVLADYPELKKPVATGGQTVPPLKETDLAKPVSTQQGTSLVTLSGGRNLEVKFDGPHVTYYRYPDFTSGPFGDRFVLASPEFGTEIKAALSSDVSPKPVPSNVPKAVSKVANDVPVDVPKSVETPKMGHVPTLSERESVAVASGKFSAGVPQAFFKYYAEFETLPISKQKAYLQTYDPAAAYAGRMAGVTADGMSILRAQAEGIAEQKLPKASVETPKPEPVSAYRQFINSGGRDSEWETYRDEQNKASKLRHAEEFKDKWERGASVSGNDVVMHLRTQGVELPSSVKTALEDDATTVSKTEVRGRGMERPEAKHIHSVVSVAMAPKTEPWKLTRAEYVDKELFGIGRQRVLNRSLLKTMHGRYTRIALSEGKPVPVNVLKDYPNLVKPVTPEPLIATEPVKAQLNTVQTARGLAMDKARLNKHVLPRTDDNVVKLRRNPGSFDIRGIDTPRKKRGKNRQSRHHSTTIGVIK